MDVARNKNSMKNDKHIGPQISYIPTSTNQSTVAYNNDVSVGNKLANKNKRSSQSSFIPHDLAAP